MDSKQLWGPCDDPQGTLRAPSVGSCKLPGSAGPGWGPTAGPWARGAPTSGRQQREAAEQQQQQRQRDEARRSEALHGAGGLGRRTKERLAAAARSGWAWATYARLQCAAFNYPARRRRGGGGARRDPPSGIAPSGHAATQPLQQGLTGRGERVGALSCETWPASLQPPKDGLQRTQTLRSLDLSVPGHSWSPLCHPCPSPSISCLLS